MAEKDNKPKTTAKPAATVKPAAKPVAKPTATAKPAATVKPVAKPTTATKPAAKPTTAAKPAATVKPVAKPTATAKPADKATVIDAKPVAKPAPAPKPTATAKPAATAKPVAKPVAKETVKPVATAKPAATAKPEPAKQAQADKPAAAAAAATAPKGAAKAAPAPAEQKPKKAAATAEKPEKAKKQSREKPAKQSGGNGSGKGGAVAAIFSDKKRVIIMAAVALVLVLALVIGIVLGAKSCNKGGAGGGNGAITIPIPTNGNYAAAGDLQPGDEYEPVSAGTETFYPASEIKEFGYDATLKTNTQVGYSARVIGEVERVVPQKTRDEGLGAYPKYGSTLSTVVGAGDDKAAMRQALIVESDYFCAQGTHNNSGNGNNGDGTYTWMDKDGNLFRGTTAEPVPATDDSGMQRKLYKHSASVGMYLEGYGNMPMLSPEEPGIIKEVTIRPRCYGSYSVTGVYAPAGEVIKIQISEEDMNATGGITIHIGQALYNGQSNNIWTAKGQMQRFPNILNTMNVNKNTATLENGVYTAYVGSFIGGPLYIRNTNKPFTATISGGVAYSHFILGVTTKEEFEANRKSTAPYFDLEVWHNGVLHSGPRFYAERYSYEDIYNVAVLWDKVASVTTTNSNQGVVFLYDPFVAAGAAVAFPGRSSVNCPADWMSSSLNYNGIVTGGSWGNFHEYHHNFQSYGVGAGGEVTNNGMTLVSYALFTKISAKRGIASYGGQGLGGWNNYTSATWALNDLLSIQRGGSPSNGKQGLAIYATLLHNFGPDNYIQAKVKQQQGRYGENYAGYFRAWEAQTHNDMTYFFKDVLQGLDQATADKFHNAEYTSMFVPVSSVYQTGRSYMYDGVKKYFKTMQPYVVPYESSFDLDLSKYDAPSGQYASGSIVIPDGFTYTVKSVVPAKGTVEKIDDFNYRYNFSGNDKLSGEIKVTLGITKDDGAFTVDDVELIVELERSHETNKMMLERTTYTYTAETMYSDAVAAYDADFAGYSDKSEWTHSNPTQNCNTDIWLCTPGAIGNFPNADPVKHLAKANTIEVIDGKLYFEEAGKYRIFLRGRKNCAVYYSVDGGQNYQLGAKVTDGSGSGFYTNNPETYFDVELDENSWVYVKEVLVVELLNASQASYLGLGYGAWTTPLYRMVEKYYDASGNEVASPEAEGYHHTTTVYYDTNDREVSAEVVAAAQPVPPASVSYINAYRCDYEFPDNSSFKTDYYYTRKYSYTYSEAYNNLTNQSFVGAHNCFYDENRTDFRPEYLFDGDLTTSCSSPAVASAANPWQFTVDLGKVIEANRFELTGRLNNGAGNQNQTPNSITLLVGETLENMKEVANFDEGAVSGITLAFNFETSTFRYYKLIVRKTVQGRFGAIANIQFSNTVPNGTLLTPQSDTFTYAGTWESVQTHSSFGHVMVGSANATVSFKFSGTRLAIRSAAAYGKNFEVTIDGVKVNSIELKAFADNYAATYRTNVIEDTSRYGASYMTDLLEDKEHTVTIKCLGEANIDSIVFFG